MNNLHIHDVKNVNLTPSRVQGQSSKPDTEFSYRELEIETEEGIFRISLYGNTIEDIKMHMEL